MKTTSKGQVTIPARIREQLGLEPGSEVEFSVVGDAVRIRKVRGGGGRGRSLVARMRGKGAVRLSTDEILAMTRR